MIGAGLVSPRAWIPGLAILTALLIASAFDASAAPRHKKHQAKHRSPPAVSDLGRAPRPEIPGPIRFPDSQIEPITWSDLDGWAADDHAAAFAMFRTSCRAVIGRARTFDDDRAMVVPLVDVCRLAVRSAPLQGEAARKFFEDNFTPARINKLGDAAGFITGYYEPVVDGSRFPTQIYKVPVYRRPRDLVPPANAVRGQGFPNSGQSRRQLADGTFVPYYDRGEIEDGALDGRRLEICWLKDANDLLFIQIQGSGRVRLEDGTMLRINYDSHNGYPYTPVGRILIERQIVPREEMSMDRIREWMDANPDGAKELRRQNRSFVFFRIVGLSDDREAAGAQGVPLTPARSIAVDKNLHVYGTPFYISADLPIEAVNAKTKLRRLMLGQDTGSAIIGAARADIYYGAGREAGRVAGRMRHPGAFAILLPRALDPVVAGLRMPLPVARPKIPEPAVAAKPGAAPAASGPTSAASGSPALPVAADVPLPQPRPRIAEAAGGTLPAASATSVPALSVVPLPVPRPRIIKRTRSRA